MEKLCLQRGISKDNNNQFERVSNTFPITMASILLELNPKLSSSQRLLKTLRPVNNTSVSVSIKYLVRSTSRKNYLMNAASPQVTSFCSISFCYTIVEMPRNLMLVYINPPKIKWVTFYIVLLKITGPIDSIKQGLTEQFLHLRMNPYIQLLWDVSLWNTGVFLGSK